MSNQQHPNARLDGWEGPFFPANLDELHAQLDIGNQSGGWLFSVLHTLPGFVQGQSVVTTDDYAWFYAAHFAFHGGDVLVLIPWSQDWDKADGTQRDRSAAVHIRAEAPDPGGVAVLIHDIAEAMARRNAADAATAAGDCRRYH